MEKIACVYEISFIGSDRRYVGSTKNYTHRKSSHLSLLRRGIHANEYLQNAFTKYGEPNIRFNVLETLREPSKRDIESAEQKWIDLYDSANRLKGFNILKKAYQPTGFGNSKENKRKAQREFMIGKTYAKGSKRSEEYKRWHSEYHKSLGKKHTEESKNKISKAHTGKVLSDSTKEKIRQVNLGKTRSEESRKSQAQSMAKLDENLIRELRRRNLEGVSVACLASEIGYSTKTMWKIVTGRSYSWVV